MRDFAVIKEPEVAKLFGCPTRRGMLRNLARREMTPAQLAKVFDKPVSSMIHHLGALEKAGLVQLARTAQRGNLVEKYYTATAREFVISYVLSEGLVAGSEDVARWTKEVCRRAASGLEAFDYKLHEGDLNAFPDLLERFAAMETAAYERVISRQRTATRLETPSLKLLTKVLAYQELAKRTEFNELMKDISSCLTARDDKPVTAESVTTKAQVLVEETA